MEKVRQVAKVVALAILHKDGPLTVTEFAEKLAAQGFRMPGPWKAWNILTRLLHQSLVHRLESTVEVRYTLKNAKDQQRAVARRQRLVRWSITDRGEKRLKYLLSLKRKGVGSSTSR